MSLGVGQFLTSPLVPYLTLQSRRGHPFPIDTFLVVGCFYCKGPALNIYFLVGSPAKHSGT